MSRSGKKRTVKDGLFQNRWARDIVGAPTTQVLCQYLAVWHLLRSVQLNPLQADRFVWRWSADGKYSASSAYRAFFVGSTSLLDAKELWRTKAPPKVKFFFWLALHGRLWTAARRKRHGLQDDDVCIMCGQEAESADHLFLGCVVTRELWYRLLMPAGLSALAPAGVERLAVWWLRQRLLLQSDARPPFDSFILLVTWCTWKERNSRTFQRTATGIDGLLAAVIREAEDWTEAGFSTLSCLIPLWSQSLAAM